MMELEKNEKRWNEAQGRLVNKEEGIANRGYTQRGRREEMRKGKGKRKR